MSVNPTETGWRVGRSEVPRGIDLWVRYDRTTGVYGAQGSGKTLDLLAPALLSAPGAALATLTKVDDLLLTLRSRHGGERPVAVLDPFGAAPGVPELVWDPIGGCVDPMRAERRAKAFAAGTVTGSVAGGRNDNAARFYAHETAKVLQGFFHAAALTGRTLDHVMEWVASPIAAEQPAEILRQHPQAARHWDGLLAGALDGSPDTVANTVTTVQQAMGLFFQPAIRTRCVPGPGREATDVAELVRGRGTIYLLGREDPYAPSSPLMTAVAEDVLDTALAVAAESVYGRLCPPFLACLDELPSTAPLPTLRVRMANERALGISFIYAAQTWRQVIVCYGEDEARALLGLTNNLVIFGGGKDIHFYREMSDLLGATRVARQTVTDGPGGVGLSRSAEDTPILRPEQLRLIRNRHALVVAENAPPILARLQRCLDGRSGRTLRADLLAARDEMAAARRTEPDLGSRTSAAVRYAHTHHLHPGDHEPSPSEEWAW
jgi:type IV secretory pathway TraG/TraD family ATPase VirD4